MVHFFHGTLTGGSVWKHCLCVKTTWILTSNIPDICVSIIHTEPKQHSHLLPLWLCVMWSGVGHSSGPILVNTISQWGNFFKFWHKCSPGFKDKLIRILVVKSHGPCDPKGHHWHPNVLQIHISGRRPISRNSGTEWEIVIIFPFSHGWPSHTTTRQCSELSEMLFGTNKYTEGFLDPVKSYLPLSLSYTKRSVFGCGTCFSTEIKTTLYVWSW